MKILYVTPEAPGQKSGGQIAVKQTLDSFPKDIELIYVGPFCHDIEKWTKKYFFLEKSSQFNRLKTYLKFQTSVYYYSWTKIRKKIKWEDISYIFIEFSRYDFIIKSAKKHKIKVISRIHNIEVDYSKNEFKLDKNIKNFIIYFFSKKKERIIVNNSYSIICLTENDKAKLNKIYSINNKKIYVIPICVNTNHYLIKNEFDSNRIKILITGSLWFGPNLEGIEWVINKVYSSVKNIIELYIVGSNPANSLYSIVKGKENIKIYANVESMDSFYDMCDIVMIPIFSGAGMKVKVANALSYGALTLLTPEAKIGYNIFDGYDCFIGKNETEFISCIKNLNTKTSIEINNIRKNAYNTFCKKYSTTASIRYYNDFFNTINN